MGMATSYATISVLAKMLRGECHRGIGDCANGRYILALRNEGSVQPHWQGISEQRGHIEMDARSYYVYIATNRRGTLYTGVTNDVEKRIRQHREGTSEFTAQYRIGKLVYVEVTDDVWAALEREKQIKGWTRDKKLALIRSTNSAFRDLSVAGYCWRRGVEASRARR